MSVGEQLGLDDPNDGLRVLARQRWASWVERHPSLGVAAGPEELRAWLRRSAPDERDALLGVLGRLGSARGGDDCAAAGILLWVLLPGATALAHRLRRLSPVIDELVAAQLWVEARTLPPTTTGRLPARILRNTYREVRRDLGRVPPRDTLWSLCDVVDPSSRDWLDTPAPGEDVCARAELELLLDRACREEVISTTDRHLLLRLVSTSDGQVLPRRCSRGGVTAHPVTVAVGSELGVAERTVRRRAARSLDALTVAYSLHGGTA
ncbi:hypothetical protein [Knoellia aerolata]|uniref:Uncharacterized protein n=1 Tax=Knoellia aerolata DSM 18566 TaxID=1385519 RepID=A0A0A0JWL0_9MICO|nr:hypothetical protein [Knoellia aerolata]KGN41049.1 hypothetical protein N801_09740 [Knoellia aerolata DSM 18566]